MASGLAQVITHADIGILANHPSLAAVMSKEIEASNSITRPWCVGRAVYSSTGAATDCGSVAWKDGVVRVFWLDGRRDSTQIEG